VSVTWRKVGRDLLHNKTRTILAILSTAVGVFALGFIFSTSAMIREQMTAAMAASRPAHITMTLSPIDDALLNTVRRTPGVMDAGAVVNSYLHWKRPGDADWQAAALTARDDFTKQQIALVYLENGVWPEDNTLAVERQSMNYFGIHPGDSILVERGDLTRSVKIVGTVRSLDVYPPQMGGPAAFYATPDTAEWLTGSREFNQVNIRLTAWDKTAADQTAKDLRQRFIQSGVYVGGYSIQDPNVHYAQQILDGMFAVLGGLGVVSLALSAFLIVNTLNALVAQQVWQIGIMKVVGATTARIVRLYLSIALIYGSLALLLAIPLSALGAQVMVTGLLAFFNITAAPVRFVPEAVVLQLAVGLTVPMIAALFPVIGGARISAHRAISNYGLGGGFGQSRIDRVLLLAQQKLGWFQRVPRPFVLSLRNTFRRKARVALTLLTLTLSGVMFVTVMSVGASLNKTLEDVIGDFGFDILLTIDRQQRMDKLNDLARRVPGVQAAETWDIQGGTKIKLPGGGEKDTQLWAIPPDSKMFHFHISAGRALSMSDERAILVNQKIAQEEHLSVGQVLTLNINGKDSDWTVVGFIINLNNGQRDCFVPFESLAREIGSTGRASTVVVSLQTHNLESETAAINGLRDTFTAAGWTPVDIMGLSKVRAMNKTQFDILVNMLLTMAVLAAVVGSLGLMGTMSINVVERGREIGLMRAIGAATPTVAGIFIGEGLLLGWISWLLAIPFSIPGAYLFNVILSQAIMPMAFSFSIPGLITWLLIVCVLSTVASLWPAVRATRISVRESLAYE
jgi:putative ABC transport system permease protein